MRVPVVRVPTYLTTGSSGCPGKSHSVLESLTVLDQGIDALVTIVEDTVLEVPVELLKYVVKLSTLVDL